MLSSISSRPRSWSCLSPMFQSVPPRTWLLRVGWRRHGLVDPAEVPGAAVPARATDDAGRVCKRRINASAALSNLHSRMVPFRTRLPGADPSAHARQGFSLTRDCVALFGCRG